MFGRTSGLTRARRLTLVLAVLLPLVALLAPASTAAPLAAASPDWVPFKGGYPVWCTMSNPGWAGCSGHHSTPALDIGMPVGTPIYAAGDGTVHDLSLSDSGGAGRFVAIAHPDGTYSRYLHLSVVEVGGGQRVGRGDRIGQSGSTGSSTSPHLHYDEMKPYGTRIDPGIMLGLEGGLIRTYPGVLGHASWWTLPYGSVLGNDDFPYLFLDVSHLHPFLEEIEWLLQQGITTGYTDGTFRSHDPVLRQAMAAFLYRLAGSPPGPFPDPGYTDVSSTHPFFDEIAWLTTTGVTTGLPDGSFGNFSPVKRQAMAAFLYRLAGSPPGPFPDPGFIDVPASHPFFQEIAWLATTGITTGYPDGTFRPNNAVSRQAMAVFLYRYAT